MPINSLAREYSLHTSKEIVFLNGVFDEIKRLQKTAEPWQEAALARQVCDVYRSGVTDRELLLKTLNRNHSNRKFRRGVARGQFYRSPETIFP